MTIPAPRDLILRDIFTRFAAEVRAARPASRTRRRQRAGYRRVGRVVRGRWCQRPVDEAAARPGRCAR
jgi:hypothetical protein